MKPIRGVLLDVDGTLVDSNDAHAHAWIDALAEHGIQASYEEVRRRIGKGGDKLLAEVTGISEDSPEGKALSNRRSAIFRERYLPKLRPTPGASDLLRHMREQGLQLIVATSAKKEELQGLLKICGADWLIDESTSSDDAERSKPDPDIVGAALKQGGLRADDVYMLGDTPYDIEAARRAGVTTIAFRCGGWGDRDLAGALGIYNDPADLLARYYTSPLAHTIHPAAIS
jgi:HAD superfamily hydrolase (TIGR01509 family)